MHRNLICISIPLSVLLSPAGFADSPATDSTNLLLQGRWEIVGGVNQGRELTSTELAGTYVTVTTNSIVTFDAHEQQRHRAGFILDDTKNPVEITMTALSSDSTTEEKTVEQKTQAPANEVATGILKFNGDEKWILCYALPGAVRPTEFKSATGSKIMLFMLERKSEKLAVPSAVK